MPSRVTLRLGTRASLLARAQARLVARALRAADPGIDVELVTLDTRGDRNRTVPLSEVTDPGFFCAELDAALRAGEVDFCVHSLKDLPLAPRPGIRTAAIPAREDPRDVVLFRAGIDELIASSAELRVGTSSTRRAAYTGAFLPEALPHAAGKAPALSLRPLRGPVEQRLARLRLPRTSVEALDGVVLALAGLSRLWGDREGHAHLAPLLAGTRFMVLPLSVCPAAPGQGALAVECRSGDEHVARLLGAIGDAPATRRARHERALLAAVPEGERDGFGATAIEHPSCGTLVFTRSPGAGASRLLWDTPPRPCAARPWDGADWAEASRYRPLARPEIGAPAALFIAHWRAFAPKAAVPRACHVWVSGVESWRRLARRGLWIEGCADHLGFDALTPLLASPVLRLPPLRSWTVLTHEDAIPSWSGAGVGRVLPAYAITPPEDASTLAAIRRHIAQADHFFWGSAAQFRALRSWLPAGSHHACGPGKTYAALRAEGVANLRAFPSRQEWRAWLA